MKVKLYKVWLNDTRSRSDLECTCRAMALSDQGTRQEMKERILQVLQGKSDDERVVWQRPTELPQSLRDYEEALNAAQPGSNAQGTPTMPATPRGAGRPQRGTTPTTPPAGGAPTPTTGATRMAGNPPIPDDDIDMGGGKTMHIRAHGALVFMTDAAGNSWSRGANGWIPDPTNAPPPPPEVKTPTDVFINPANTAITVGRVATLTVVILDQNNQPMTAPVQWASDNPSVATVGDNGWARGLSRGTATISATAGIFTGYSTIVVQDPPRPPGNGGNHGGNNGGGGHTTDPLDDFRDTFLGGIFKKKGHGH